MTVAAPPLILPRYRSPRRYDFTRGGEVVRLSERHLRMLKGPTAGQSLQFLNWQRFTYDNLYELRDPNPAAPEYRYRRGLIGVGRQNGKSIIGTGAAIDALYTGPPGSEVYSAAGDKKQARIVFGEVSRQIEQSPRLAKHARLYRDAIEIPALGNVYRVLSADAKLQQGLSPYLVIFDEVHVQPNDELWSAMAYGMGARPNALLLGITTAGDHEESLCGRLYDYGQRVASGEVDDESFLFLWWEPADEKCDLWDRDAWHQANPSMAEGVLLEEDMEVSVRMDRPGAVRRYRLNQWVAHGGTRWMDMPAWDDCADESVGDVEGEKRIPVVVSFDGSVNEDATALSVIRADKDVPVLIKTWVWERQPEDGDDWAVPRDEVDAVVEEVFADFKVVRMGCDPAYWRSEIQGWQSRFGGRKVLEWPVTDARMGPAVTETYKRVMEGSFVHSGDPTVRRHVRNAVEKPVRGGHVTIRKQSPKSEHKIDAAVTVCVGIDLWSRYSRKKGTLVSV
jgi:phage terminase large subunit-like protein